MTKSLLLMTKGDLQIRMTVFVTSAVLLVSTAALVIIAGRIRRDYEGMLDKRISKILKVTHFDRMFIME